MLKALRTHWETTPLIADTLALACLALIFAVGLTVAFAMFPP